MKNVHKKRKYTRKSKRRVIRGGLNDDDIKHRLDELHERNVYGTVFDENGSQTETGIFNANVLTVLNQMLGDPDYKFFMEKTDYKLNNIELNEDENVEYTRLQKRLNTNPD